MTIETTELIKMLIENPISEFQTGMNSVVINLLKRSAGLVVEAMTYKQTVLHKALKSLQPNCSMTMVELDLVIDYIDNNSKLSAVKAVKDATNLGLKDAKDVVDEYCNRL